ncbi:MAG: PilZ domain-containing protein [Deltaproteobacteria bacterium]|nr:PilZ domain-containing protein [Deltaproteobacteria bacterium]
MTLNGRSTPHQDRRTHARYNVGFGADVHTRRGVISAGTRDVSRGGCQLASSQPIEEGATVKIDLSLTIDGIEDAGFPRLTVLGRIQWTSEADDEGGPVHLSGVRFVDLTDAQAEWLQNILVQHGAPADVPEGPVEDIDIDIDLEE